MLRHEDREGVHYDLMVDTGAALTTWKCPVPPESARESPLVCRQIGDHRRLYLDYEGPISGDRGEVCRHDRGRCAVLEGSPDAWQIEFEGGKLKGPYELSRLVDDSWQLCPRSLTTGRKPRFVVLLLFLLLCAMVWFFYSRAEESYHRNICSIHDVLSALVCYVGRHDGVLPGKFEDLISDRIVTTQPDNSFLVNNDSNGGCEGKIYGFAIQNIDKFEIRWGFDLRAVRHVDDRLLASNGDEVLILVSPTGLEESRSYSIALARLAQEEN